VARSVGGVNGALLIRWGASIAGREAVGLEVFGRAVERFEQLAKEGRVHGHREYFSVTGHDGGFMLVDGELDELMHILGEDDSLRLNAQASAIVEDFEIQAFAGGTEQATQQLVGTYTAGLTDLEYI
jgi:hypothetical protein